MNVCNHCGLGINPGGRIPIKATMDGASDLYHTACYLALPDAPFTPLSKQEAHNHQLSIGCGPSCPRREQEANQ